MIRPLMRRALAVGSLCTLGVLSSACGADPTEVVLVVHCDLEPGVIDEVRIAVQGADGPEASERQSLVGPMAPPLPLTYGLRGRGGDPFAVEVTGFGGGAEVVRQRAEATFVAGHSRLLEMTLHDGCRGVTCGSGMSCSAATAGGCGPAGRDPLPPWTGSAPAGPIHVAGGFDSGPGLDAGPGVDAGPGPDAGPGVDAGPACPDVSGYAYEEIAGFEVGAAVDACSEPGATTVFEYLEEEELVPWTLPRPFCIHGVLRDSARLDGRGFAIFGPGTATASLLGLCPAEPDGVTVMPFADRSLLLSEDGNSGVCGAAVEGGRVTALTWRLMTFGTSSSAERMSFTALLHHDTGVVDLQIWQSDRNTGSEGAARGVSATTGIVGPGTGSRDMESIVDACRQYLPETTPGSGVFRPVSWRFTPTLR